MSVCVCVDRQGPRPHDIPDGSTPADVSHDWMYELSAGQQGTCSSQQQQQQHQHQQPQQPDQQQVEALGACSDDEDCMSTPGRPLESAEPARRPVQLNSSPVDLRAAQPHRAGPVLQHLTSMVFGGQEDWMFDIGVQRTEVLEQLAATAQGASGQGQVPLQQGAMPYRLQPRPQRQPQ